MTDLHKLQQEAYEIATEKGWWEEPRTTLELMALMHSEISEAVEAWRDPVRGDLPVYFDASGKPEGWLIELADCVIRIMDLCGHEAVSLESAIEMKLDYNRSRPYRHGGKRA